MAYDIKDNRADFFEPMMAVAGNSTAPLCAIDIGASSGTHGEFVCVRPCLMREFLFAVTLEAAGGSSAAPTVVFKKRPTPGSSSGESTLATLTIPDGTAIGKVVYKRISPILMMPGQSIQVSWTIGIGSPMGQGNASWVADYSPENEGNNSNMIASA